MMVFELKQLLRDVPDDYEVTIVMKSADEALYQYRRGRRQGVLGALAEQIDPLPTKFDQSFVCWVSSATAKRWSGNNYGELRLSNGDHCPSIHTAEKDVRQIEAPILPEPNDIKPPGFSPLPARKSKSLPPAPNKSLPGGNTRLLTDGKEGKP